MVRAGHRDRRAARPGPLAPSAPRAQGEPRGPRTWTAAGAEHGIDEVFAFYREWGVPFSGCVGPSSAPPDLAARLEARGLVRDDPSHVGTAALPVDGLRRNEAVRIEEVRDAAIRAQRDTS